MLGFFGITLPVLRIAGGVVVTAFGWTLLQAKEELGDQRAAKTERGPDAAIDAFYPLTMPLTVGPGAISVAIALGSTRPKEASDFAHLMVLAGVAIAGLAAVAATIYVCYRYAGPGVSGLELQVISMPILGQVFLDACGRHPTRRAATGAGRNAKVKPNRREAVRADQYRHREEATTPG